MLSGRFLVGVFLLFLACAAPAFAQQEHPCDPSVVLPSSYTLTPGELVRLGWCHPGDDGAGQPVTEWRILFPTPPGGDYPLPASKVTATPAANGEFLWESQQIRAEIAGDFTVLAVAGGLRSLPSKPLTVILGGLPPPPAPFLSPTGLRLWRQ